MRYNDSLNLSLKYTLYPLVFADTFLSLFRIYFIKANHGHGHDDYFSFLILLIPLFFRYIFVLL